MRIWEGVLCRKCFQIALRNVKNASKMPKFSACGGHIIIEIRLVMLLKCNFFAPAAAITMFLSFMLVYRAPLDKHKTLNVDPL